MVGTELLAGYADSNKRIRKIGSPVGIGTTEKRIPTKTQAHM
jgi:hypothetical protein